VAALTERADCIGAVGPGFQNRRETPQRAVAFSAQQQQQVFEVLMIFWEPPLFIAKKHCQLKVGSQKQLGQKGSRDLIRLCDVHHFPIDALMEPREHDDRNTRGGIYIWASGKLHGIVSGWWSMLLNPQDARYTFSSYHHQRFPRNCQMEFERCQKNLDIFLEGFLS